MCIVRTHSCRQRWTGLYPGFRNTAQNSEGAVMKLIYPAIFTPYFDESGYEVTIPDLSGCTASGDTLEEAIEHAKTLPQYLGSLD